MFSINLVTAVLVQEGKGQACPLSNSEEGARAEAAKSKQDGPGNQTIIYIYIVHAVLRHAAQKNDSS